MGGSERSAPPSSSGAAPGPPRLGQRPQVDLRHPPSGLAALTDWFESVSYGLVLLEPYALREVAEAIDRYEEETERHVRESAIPPPVPGAPTERLSVLLLADHAWFRISFEQLRWFYGIVAREDHGGHRQALGQYGRLVTEAMRRHLAEEARLRSASAKG